MEWIESFVNAVDCILDTKRKRHIAGGMLLSISALFSGLAVTVITIGKENSNEQ